MHERDRRYRDKLTPSLNQVTVGCGLPAAIQSKISGSPAISILVAGLLVMLGATGGSGVTITDTVNSAVPAMFCAKQLYQPADDAVVLQTVKPLVVSLIVIQSSVVS